MIETGQQPDIKGANFAPAIPVNLHPAEAEQNRLQIRVPQTVTEDTDRMILSLNGAFHPEAERSVRGRNVTNFRL